MGHHFSDGWLTNSKDYRHFLSLNDSDNTLVKLDNNNFNSWYFHLMSGKIIVLSIGMHVWTEVFEAKQKNTKKQHLGS